MTNFIVLLLDTLDLYDLGVDVKNVKQKQRSWFRWGLLVISLLFVVEAIIYFCFPDIHSYIFAMPS